MPEPRINKGLARPVPRVRDGMSESHLAMVRKLPCCVCEGCGPVNAHHLLRTGDPTQRGTGRKAADKFAIPLGMRCHTFLHAHGNDEVYLMGLGIDGRALASALWAARGDQEAMERIVFRFRQTAEQKRGAA
jgi:hypothetical protein